MRFYCTCAANVHAFYAHSVKAHGLALCIFWLDISNVKSQNQIILRRVTVQCNTTLTHTESHKPPCPSPSLSYRGSTRTLTLGKV